MRKYILPILLIVTLVFGFNACKPESVPEKPDQEQPAPNPSRNLSLSQNQNQNQSQNRNRSHLRPSFTTTISTRLNLM